MSDVKSTRDSQEIWLGLSKKGMGAGTYRGVRKTNVMQGGAWWVKSNTRIGPERFGNGSQVSLWGLCEEGKATAVGEHPPW